MKVVTIGLDSAILDKTSSIAERFTRTGRLVAWHDVIVPGDTNGMVRLSDTVTVYSVKRTIKAFWLVRAARLLNDLMRKNQYDIISTKDPYFLGVVAAYYARVHGVGLEIQVHGFEKLLGFRALIARRVLAHATGIRTVSERLKRRLVRDFNIASDRVMVSPIFVDCKGIQNQAVSEQREDVEIFTFITVGRLVPVKCIALQIRAFAVVHKRFPRTRLLIVGDGPLRNELKVLAEQEGVSEQVAFVGWVDDVVPYLRQADCFVLTSREEGYGLAVVEAASFGLPIIMTDVGCANDIIVSGKNGIIVPVDSMQALETAMTALRSDVQLRRRFAEVNRTTVCEKLPSLEETLQAQVLSWKKIQMRSDSIAHNKQIKIFYEQEAQKKFGHEYEKNRWFSNQIDRERYAMLAKTLRLRLRAIRFSRCFELGPGPGTWTKLLLEHAPQSSYVLLDISESMKKQFEQNVETTATIRYLLGDFEQYVEREKQYDFFFSSRAIEYIQNKQHAVSKIWDLLLPGGSGMVITKTPHYTKKWLLGQHTPWYHRNQISPNKLIELLRKQGFTDIRAYPVIIYVPILGRAHWINRMIYGLVWRSRLRFFTQWISEAYMVTFRK